MTRKEKIEKLNKLKIYDLWENNVINLNVSLSPNELLDMDVSWALFISISFAFEKSEEGSCFWIDIALQS